MTRPGRGRAPPLIHRSLHRWSTAVASATLLLKGEALNDPAPAPAPEPPRPHEQDRMADPGPMPDPAFTSTVPQADAPVLAAAQAISAPDTVVTAEPAPPPPAPTLPDAAEPTADLAATPADPPIPPPAAAITTSPDAEEPPLVIANPLVDALAQRLAETPAFALAPLAPNLPEPAPELAQVEAPAPPVVPAPAVRPPARPAGFATSPATPPTTIPLDRPVLPQPVFGAPAEAALIVPASLAPISPEPADLDLAAARWDALAAQLRPALFRRLPQPLFGGIAETPLFVGSLSTPDFAPAADTADAPASPATDSPETAAPLTTATAPPPTDHTALVMPPHAKAAGIATLLADPAHLGDAGSAAPPLAGTPEFTDDDQLILEIGTAHHELSDTLEAYRWKAQTYLPLGAIARFLDLALTVSDDGHYASGWVLDPKRTVQVNLRDHTLVIDGKSRPLGPGDAAAYNGELFLRADAFPTLMPLALTVDLRAQTVAVKTNAPFPFEQRAAREEARDRLASRGSKPPEPIFPREPTPYRLLSFPLADVEARLASDSTYGTRAEADVRVAGDLAWLTARAFASLDNRQGLVGAHLEMGRRDPDARLLGPLHASEFEFGDVSTDAMPIGLASVSGRGATLTNAPLARASVFDTIDLTGDLPAGTEVELYRNDILLDSSNTPVNGQYQFLHVPVEFGLNLFRLVFYGPQGQRREVLRQVNVGDGRLGKGELVYHFDAVQRDVSLFNRQPAHFLPGPDYGSWRGSGQFEYGLTNALTLAAGGAFTQNAGTRTWLATAGLRAGIAGVATRLDLAAESGGEAAQISLAGRALGFGYTFTHGEYFGTFTDEVRSLSPDPVRRADTLSLSGSLRLGGGTQPLRLPIYLLARRIEFADGHRLTDVSLRQSFPFVPRVTLSNVIDYANTRGADGSSSTQLTGSFDLATMTGSRTQVHATVNYQVLPQPHVGSAQLAIDHTLDTRTSLRGQISRSFETGQSMIGVSAARRFDRFTLALDASYAIHPRQYTALLRLGMSFGRNPLSGRLFIDQPGLASSGAAVVRAFRDNDGDGRFSPGDTPLPEVAFGSGSEHAVTGKDGTALLGRLGDGRRASVQVDPDSLPDIALAPVRRGFEIAPRAGRIHVADFPIEALGEIDGAVWFSQGGKDRAVSGVAVALVDANGKTIKRARTEGDGSFWIEKVHAGHYTLRLDPEQAGRLHIHLTAEHPIEVTRKGTAVRETLRVAPD